MSNPIIVGLTLLAALGSGLVGGVFFAFSAFIMSALGRIPPDQGIAAMQSINVAVLNPWFFTAFFGTAGVCVVLAVFALFAWNEPGAIVPLAGAVLYLLGTILVTIRCNVPLNRALAAVRSASPEGVETWTRYQTPWTAWNHVRMAASLAAAALFIIALL
jgi:uncharacterized membrane protein